MKRRIGVDLHFRFLFLTLSCAYGLYNLSVIPLSRVLIPSLFFLAFDSNLPCPLVCVLTVSPQPLHISMRVLGRTVACIHLCVLRCIVVLPTSLPPSLRLFFALGFYMNTFRSSSRSILCPVQYPMAFAHSVDTQSASLRGQKA